MRVTKQQALLLHNEAVKIRGNVNEFEKFCDMIFAEGNELATIPASMKALIKENIKEIYDSLNNQQAVVSYFLNGVAAKKPEQKAVPESWESNLIEELDLSDSEIRLLKRKDIFSINSLISFLQFHSLTEIKGCGVVKAEKIETALEKYLETR